MNNPVLIPSSPPQSPPRRRSSAFGYESNRDYSGSPYRAHRHRTSSGSSFNNNHRSSHNAASAPPEERHEQFSRDEPENQPQSSGGGVAGWLRSHFGGNWMYKCIVRLYVELYSGLDFLFTALYVYNEYQYLLHRQARTMNESLWLRGICLIHLVWAFVVGAPLAVFLIWSMITAPLYTP